MENTPPPLTEPSAELRWKLFLAALAAAVILLYLPSLWGEKVWDDYSLLSGEAIGGGETLRNCFTQPFLGNFFRPMVSVAFFLQRRLFGDAILGYHLVSLMLHLAATLLFALVMLRATGSRRAAAAASTLYAVQSCRLGSAAWVGGQTDTLMCAWLMLALWSTLRGIAAARWAGWLLLSTASYAMALLTKEQALAAAPMTALAVAMLMPKSSPDRATRLRLMGGAWALCAVLFVLVGSRLGLPKPTAGLALYNLTEIAQMAAASFVHYMLLMTVPTQRSLHLIGLQEYAPGSALMLLLCAALAALSLYTLRRLWRTCRGAAWLGTLCLLGLLPIVNLLPVPFLQLAPYRAALPGIGLCAVFGWLAADASRRAASPQQGALIQTAAAAVLVWNTANTVVGSRTWMREEVLFRSLEHYNPRHPTAHFLLAYFLMTTGRPAEAAEHWQRELTLLYQGTQWRTESGALQGLSDPQIRRSLRQNQGGTWDERIFASSLQTRLAYCLLELRRPAEAAVHYRIAAAVDPNNMDARQGAGYALLQTGDLHESSRYSLQAAEREPDRIDAWVNFVRASAALNDYAAVKRGYAGWMQAAPNQTTPYLELARIQLNRRDLAGAAGTLTEALKKWPDRADIRSLMALVEAGGIETGPPPSP